MENPKISETTREKLEDAAVSVFMEQYTKALDAGIDRKMEECTEDVFPPELDRRCHALIRQEYRKERNRKRRKNALRVLRSAAVVAVALLSLCSVLFVTVEAFRLPVINFFVQKTERYWQMSGQENSNEIPNVFNPEDPLGNVLPDDFVLTSLIGSLEEGYLNADYSNGIGATISLVISPAIGKWEVDTEDAFAEECKVRQHNAIKSVENEFIRISWLDAEKDQVITLLATNVPINMMEYFSESIAVILE